MLIVHLPARALVAVTFLVLSVIAPLGPAQSQSVSRGYDLNIARQPITKALQALSSETGFQHGYLPTNDEEEQILVGPLKGRYTVDDALIELLPPGFTHDWIDERTFSVIPPPMVTPPRLYLGDNTLEDESVPSVFERARKKFEGILVVASRMWRLDPLDAPRIVLSREDIETLGASTVPQVVQYLSQQPYSRSEGYRDDGAQGVELRGLGSDTTLVLVNGHRVGASARSYDSNAFDLNTIPLIAVERIEVLLDSTPLSVGADAFGGMINIVLADDIRAPKIDLHYGTADGGAREQRVSFAAGLANERLRFSTVLDYFSRDRLLGEERERWRNQDYRRFGGSDFRSLDANPGNIRSLTGENLPGLTSSFAAVPTHPTGERLSPEDFIATAGMTNLESSFAFRSIVPEAERLSAMASVDVTFSSSSSLFGEVLYSSRENVTRALPVSVSSQIVPASNAFNPFGVPLLSNFLLGPIEREHRTETEFVRTLLGLRGDRGDWNWELTVLRTADAGQFTTHGDLNSARLVEALAQSDPVRALNVFDDGPGGTSELLTSLIATPTIDDYGSESTQATALLRGSLFSLPAGNVSSLVGADWREARIAVAGVPLGSPTRSASGGFVEVRVPIVGREWRMPAIEDLAITLSHRVDRYSDLDTLSNSQFRLSWQPTGDIAVRGTYGTAIRLPSLYEMYQPVTTLPFGFPDPRRGNEIRNILFTFGGNPALTPATGESWSAGLSYASKSPSLFRGSATYWHTQMTDRIGTVDLLALLTHDELFQNRVIRAAPTANDIAAGWPGVIESVDVSSGSDGNLVASGIDLATSLVIDTRIGRFTPELSATWMEAFKLRDVSNPAGSNRVGVASVFGTIPKWRAIASLTWSSGDLRIGGTARFASSYDDLSWALNEKNGRVIPAQVLFDVQASLRLDGDPQHDALWRGLRITAGVTNVLNEQPAFADFAASFGYDPSQGDLKERFGYLRLTKDF